MELIGLVVAFLVAFIVALLYVFLFNKLGRRFNQSRRIIFILSLVVIISFVIEVVLISILGPIDTFVRLHSFFTLIHLFNIVFLPLALSNLFLLRSFRVQNTKWLLAISIAVVTLGYPSMLLAGIAIDEAIVGVDAPKPFFMYSNDEIINVSLNANRGQATSDGMYMEPGTFDLLFNNKLEIMDKDGSITYGIVDSSGNSLIQDPIHFSAYQRWYFVSDEKGSVWVHSSDVGGVLYERSSKNTFVKKDLTSEICQSSPDSFKNNLPNVLKNLWKCGVLKK